MRKLVKISTTIYRYFIYDDYDIAEFVQHVQTMIINWSSNRLNIKQFLKEEYIMDTCKMMIWFDFFFFDVMVIGMYTFLWYFDDFMQI